MIRKSGNRFFPNKREAFVQEIMLNQELRS